MNREYFEAISHEAVIDLAVILSEKEDAYIEILKELSERTCETCELYDGKYCLKFNVFHVITHYCKEWRKNDQ